jgi:hypothetical protein
MEAQLTDVLEGRTGGELNPYPLARTTSRVVIAFAMPFTTNNN